MVEKLTDPIDVILLCAEVRRFLDDIYGIDIWRDIERVGDMVVVTIRDSPQLYDAVRAQMGEHPNIEYRSKLT